MNPQLLYAFEPGPLSESIADVFASLVKQHALGRGVDRADWLLGLGMIAPGIKAEAPRSLAAPGTAYEDDNLGKDPQLTATAIGGRAREQAGRIRYDGATGGKPTDEATFAEFAKLTATVARDRYGTGTEPDAVTTARKTVGVL
ncbi:M4 family metallopeptidase [Kitasatospora sp. NPDC093806]|uniref:M4 family metallopeptidase n=1 Tax=Kitasatospora sp. NPDC093806 TaxID=3155075 RepID=UPI003436CB0B